MDPEKPVTRTEAQKRALDDYNLAAQALAAASMAMRKAQDEYQVASDEYLRAHGAARAVGVI